ncbi:hypothetical protein PDJAM_G00050590 [Pangasius djambal]|uniref:Uncharacterized protein n=1 Tax=Pangasius djambal TaxID=1691987 RepID=A0ACC5YVW1_9TELE|nr:hypothetical protein [Pangasius djambal]
MGRSQELSEFQRGTVIGCHLCNKSSRKISSLLNIPQSTVSFIITKWKSLGTTATQPRSGRPRKLTERGQRMLKRIVQRGRRLSSQSIATEIQTSCDLQISPSTVRRELHGMGFHGRAAASKPHITKLIQLHKPKQSEHLTGPGFCPPETYVVKSTVFLFCTATMSSAGAPDVDPDADFVYDYETLRIIGLSIAGVLVFLSILLLFGNRIRGCRKSRHKAVSEAI